VECLREGLDIKSVPLSVLVCAQSCGERKQAVCLVGIAGLWSSRHCVGNVTVTGFQKSIFCAYLFTEEAQKDVCGWRPALKLSPVWSKWIFNQSSLELDITAPCVLLVVPGLWSAAVAQGVVSESKTDCPKSVLVLKKIRLKFFLCRVFLVFSFTYNFTVIQGVGHLLFSAAFG